MCTVSWVRSADAEGFDLFFSRDEARTRGPERPPVEFESEGVRYLAPTDSDAGGTWVCVNEFGLALGLLNGYAHSRGPARPDYTSRGRLVRELAASATPNQAFHRLTSTALSEYRPLVLVGIAPDSTAQVLRWDGRTVERVDPADALVPLSSSGFDPILAQQRRSELLAAARAARPSDPAAALLDFHSGSGVAPDATTACMSRDDAETRSLVHIAVRPGDVTLAHAPGRPDRTRLGEPQHLARRIPR